METTSPTATATGAERRQHYRVRCTVPLELHRTTGQRVLLTCSELSTGGALCRCTSELEHGEQVVAVLKLGHRVIRAIHATIVRRSDAPGRRSGDTEIAVSFRHRRGTDTERVIARYVLDRQRELLRATR